MIPSAFDAFASTYDTDFTHTHLGQLLRQRVWRVLAQQFHAGQHILELTCGTGEDAVWLAQQGANVTATDEGQWSAIVPGGIEAGPLELTITSQPKEGGATVRGATRQLVVPERTAPQLAAATPARSNAGTAVTGIKAPSPRVAPQPIERPQGEVKRSSPTPARARAES